MRGVRRVGARLAFGAVNGHKNARLDPIVAGEQGSFAHEGRGECARKRMQGGDAGRRGGGVLRSWGVLSSMADIIVVAALPPRSSRRGRARGLDLAGATPLAAIAGGQRRRPGGMAAEL